MNIEELEILRKKARNIVGIGTLVSIILAIVLYFATYSFGVLFFGFVIGLSITMAISSDATRKFTLAYKDQFVLESLKSVFSDLTYMPDNGLDQYVISNTHMMKMGDRYSSNDYITARYKNINVEQADVHIEEKHEHTDSEGNTTTTWVTLFMGRWMVFDFNKNFRSNMQVVQKGFRNSTLTRNSNEPEYSKVMMEDQAFNKQFRIHAQSEHEAFYILTPSLIEKIKRLADNVQGKLMLCFIDNKLHIGIQNNDDSFEHSIYRRINVDRDIEEVSKDIRLITDCIDELGLDNNLFKMEG